MTTNQMNRGCAFSGFVPACPKTSLPVDTAVTMAYVPYQTDSAVYCAETALANGTLFPCLDKKFYGGNAK